MIKRLRGVLASRPPLSSHSINANPASARGMVTAELAVGLIAAVLIAAMLSWVISLVGLHIRCIDTAGAMARQYARGDEAAAASIRSAGPAGAAVSVSRTADLIRVGVKVQASWGPLGPIQVGGQAAVKPEPGVGERSGIGEKPGAR